ncbi:Epsilon-sarcoglycan [Aphelenchoides bicaudatus]|nr:Epsilon-sarcoglycan [Aphelenchoides bicaudatus]
MKYLLSYLLLLLAFFSLGIGAYYTQTVRNVEVHASKGRFMVHMLHSAYFYKNTVNVKWSATAKGKPDLPFWLHLFPSRHRGIAYLIGTPVTPLHQIVIHVIALSLDTYEKADQYVTIMLSDDVRYNSSTQQIVEMRVKNIEAEEFLNPHADHIKRLERSIHETFRGKGVNPYVYSIYPEFVPETNLETRQYYRPPIKSGSIIQIGTQANFHPNVMKLTQGLRSNPDYCTQNAVIPLDKHFKPAFQVDWCQFSIRNVTQLKGAFLPIVTTDRMITLPKYTPPEIVEEPKPAEEKPSDIQEFNKLNKVTEPEKTTTTTVTKQEGNYNVPQTYYFWQTVFIFPLIAALLICLIFILSLIFFGRREGQQWRDYKTPKEQLHEYLNVRESQRQLRELSVQRQVLLSPNRSKSGTPLGVQDFLKSKENSPATKKRNPITDSQSRLNPPTPTTVERRVNSTTFDDGLNERLPPRSSVGKQTVAEAAKLTNSNVNLYRNPLDFDDDFDSKHDY